MSIETTKKQEPYGYFKYDLRLDAWVKSRDTNSGVAFYTHPPKREWVSLTDEDMRLCLAAADYNQAQYKRTQYWAHLATAIDAKLQEKNA